MDLAGSNVRPRAAGQKSEARELDRSLSGVGGVCEGASQHRAPTFGS